jgi:lysylphosphatidylglycerol synthetase-like protein (DUF2156 family)
MIVDPSGTLWKVSVLAVLAGILWAALAVAGIYSGSTRLSPRIPRDRIWADWRQRRVVWGLSLLLTMLGAWLTGGFVAQRVGFRDLYWLTRDADIMLISRLGSLCGYLFLLLLVTVGALLRRRKRRVLPGRPKDPDGAAGK